MDRKFKSKKKLSRRYLAPLLLILILLCGTLTACSASDTNDGPTLPTEAPPALAEPMPPAETTADITDNTAPPAEQPPAPVQPPAEIPPIEPGNSDTDYVRFIDEEKLYYRVDDSDAEEWYTTVLADLSALKYGEPVIALREKPADFSAFRRFDETDLAKKGSVFDYDMRGCDVSELDLSVIRDYNEVTFDSNTVFPSDPAKLPGGFNRERILEFNKNPGLGIRALHEQGITGRGVGVAIIDQALLTEHEQYRDNLMFYERIHCGDWAAQMHGPGVSSIAVGKDIGVAPGAKLYYIAETHMQYTADGQYIYDKKIVADCILRVLDINRHLPQNEKIRVISISLGFNPSDDGFRELRDAIRQADSENVFVITTSTDLFYNGFNLFGADRDYYASPENFISYSPAGWVLGEGYGLADCASWNIFPMGSRTYASCNGASDYEIAHDGGLSWAVPWCAGFYALCCQVKPDITPQEFIGLLNETGVPVNTTVYPDMPTRRAAVTFGRMVNPKAIIDALRGE